MEDKKEITLRLPDDVYRALETKSKEFGLTLNAVIITVLLNYFRVF